MDMCDYARGEVLAHSLTDREATGRRVFAHSPSGEAHGLRVDSEGAVWVAFGFGRQRRPFPARTVWLDRELDVPADFVSSVCFGGSDHRDLYITTVGAALFCRAQNGGRAGAAGSARERLAEAADAGQKAAGTAGPAGRRNPTALDANQIGLFDESGLSLE